ncbi:3-hydroxyacyl-CoA dehydrogenase [Ensifer sp. ENS04]|uniref:3-hydroxyacyl-CoA dehydrogenase n=1 Tax=Ensifer sp. ENS04 TaxID=2769281 RepID=UPI0032B1C06E
MSQRSEFAGTVGIIGAGAMGRGIAQLLAEAGLTTLLVDAVPGVADSAREFCCKMISRKVEKGSLSPDAASTATARIHAIPTGSSIDYQALSNCRVVIEAATENLEIKHSVLAGLEMAVSDDCIIATNTSSLSVTAFAAKARRAERIAGLHFFNPVTLMPLVELIAGAHTAEWVIEELFALVRRTAHTPVRVADTPGFLVNHAGRAFGTEAARVVQEGICGFDDVDRVMVEAAGFRMGPFELFDLTGLDVTHRVTESIYQQFYDEPRLRPTVLTAQRFTAGLFGRKSGQGFYAYQDGKLLKPIEAMPESGRTTRHRVWVSPKFADAALMVRDLMGKLDITLETDGRPSDEALIVVTPFGQDATTTALAEGLDPKRTVAIDCLFDLSRRRTVMHTPATARYFRDMARNIFSGDRVPVTVIDDSPGFIAQRIVACVVNVSAEIAQQRIAEPSDIDRATKLALGYPLGTLEFADVLGARRILNILEAMHQFYGDPRYRPSPWLKRRALLGMPIGAIT